jgi:hypothetical protein
VSKRDTFSIHNFSMVLRLRVGQIDLEFYSVLG